MAEQPANLKVTEPRSKKDLDKLVKERVKYYKQTHDVVYDIKVGGYYCLLKEPDRNVYSSAMSLLMAVPGLSTRKDTDLIGAGTKILQGAWLEGDEQIMSQDKLLVSAAMPAIQLLDVVEAEIKKN